jgi:SAM-dependent methyltransferase
MNIYTYDFFVGRSVTVVQSASVVVPVLKELLSPESVLDVGCGYGEWLDAFGLDLDDMVGVDIASPVVRPEFYLWHDLREPLDLARTFDLVLSMEVGEHLPESAAETYVDSLVRHGDTIVFSAAVPGQEGKGHINCQPHGYWHEMFEARGYQAWDSIRPRIQDYRVSPWYRDNIFLYRRTRLLR